VPVAAKPAAKREAKQPLTVAEPCQTYRVRPICKQSHVAIRDPCEAER